MDLNILWPPTSPPTQVPSGLRKILKVAQELEYKLVAINAVVRAKGKFTPAGPNAETISVLEDEFPKLRILRRITFILELGESLPSGLQGSEPYDIVAVLPRAEKALQSAATTLDIDIITADPTVRLPYVLRHSTAGAAVSRGVKFEVCYGAATAANAESRRQAVANAQQIFRACRGNGIILSSGASSPASLRAPLDTVNLATVWGLNQNRAREAIEAGPRAAALSGKLRYISAKQAVVIEPPLKKLKMS